MKIRDRIESLRRTFPNIHEPSARYLYNKPADMAKKGKTIVLITMLWSLDGRASMHRTLFNKKRAMTVPEWAGWLQANSREIMTNSVLAYVNRSFGSAWQIDRVFGWHFATGRRRK